MQSMTDYDESSGSDVTPDTGATTWLSTGSPSGCDFPAGKGSTHRRAKRIIPENEKDEKYWQKRKRNNMAAKRSRENKRLVEQAVQHSIQLLKEQNALLHRELLVLKQRYGLPLNPSCAMSDRQQSQEMPTTLNSHKQELKLKTDPEKRHLLHPPPPPSSAPFPLPFSPHPRAKGEHGSEWMESFYEQQQNDQTSFSGRRSLQGSNRAPYCSTSTRPKGEPLSYRGSATETLLPGNQYGVYGNGESVVSSNTHSNNGSMMWSFQSSQHGGSCVAFHELSTAQSMNQHRHHEQQLQQQQQYHQPTKQHQYQNQHQQKQHQYNYQQQQACGSHVVCNSPLKLPSISKAFSEKVPSAEVGRGSNGNSTNGSSPSHYTHHPSTTIPTSTTRIKDASNCHISSSSSIGKSTIATKHVSIPISSPAVSQTNMASSHDGKEFHGRGAPLYSCFKNTAVECSPPIHTCVPSSTSSSSSLPLPAEDAPLPVPRVHVQEAMPQDVISSF